MDPFQEVFPIELKMGIFQPAMLVYQRVNSIKFLMTHPIVACLQGPRLSDLVRGMNTISEESSDTFV